MTALKMCVDFSIVGGKFENLTKLSPTGAIVWEFANGVYFPILIGFKIFLVSRTFLKMAQKNNSEE